MTPIRTAVVGVGHLGRIHARLLASLDAFSLVGVVDPLEAHRDEVARQFGARAFADHRELLGQVDAAIIATPTSQHHAVALDFLAHGAHLLVEKPLTAKAHEAIELAEVAQQRGCVLQVGHIERFNPVWTKALPYLQQPRYIEAHRAGSFTGRSTDIGVVFDLMIHDLDLVLSLVTSPVRHVEAVGLAILGAHEDTASARLTFDNGCVASLTASRVSAAPSRSMQVWSNQTLASLDFAARNGTVVVPSEAVLRKQLRVESLSTAGRLAMKDRLSEFLPVVRIEPETSDAITCELEDFAKSIRTGQPPRVSGQQALRAVEVAEEIVAQIARQNASPASVEFGQAPPAPKKVPAPHFSIRVASPPAMRREAG